MHTVLGIDLGTQSLKIVVYDCVSRQVLARSSAPLDVDRDESGRAEQHTRDWVNGLRLALRQLSVETFASIQAISVSGQQHGFVPVDSNGDALAPVKLWCDTSTQTEADEITELCGGTERCIEISGNPILTGYTAPKILWLRKKHPDLYQKMAHVLLPHDYLNFVLTGEIAMEFGDASGTGLMNVRTRRWCKEILKAIDPLSDLEARLPDIRQADEVMGYTTTECAATFGIPEGIPVAVGGGDNMMAAIGTGNVSEGKLTMSLGTSGTLFAYSNTPVIDDRGNIAAFCSSTGGWLPLLCTMNCTFATETIRKPLNIDTAQFDESIADIPSASDGLLVLPFFGGERTPNLPHAAASIQGLSTHNCSPGHLLRATVEGATYALRFGLDELRGLGIQASEIVLTGGGANSKVWRQIVADITRLPVSILEQDEGAAFGAALQALFVLQHKAGEVQSIAEVTESHLTQNAAAWLTPDSANAALYEEAYANYRKAVDAIQ